MTGIMLGVANSKMEKTNQLLRSSVITCILCTEMVLEGYACPTNGENEMNKGMEACILWESNRKSELRSANGDKEF